MFAALALLPVDDVERIHTKMIAEKITYPELRAFNANYFLPTWIRKIRATSDNENAHYEIKEWNCHERLDLITLIILLPAHIL